MTLKKKKLFVFFSSFFFLSFRSSIIEFNTTFNFLFSLLWEAFSWFLYSSCVIALFVGANIDKYPPVYIYISDSVFFVCFLLGALALFFFPLFSLFFFYRCFELLIEAASSYTYTHTHWNEKKKQKHFIVVIVFIISCNSLLRFFFFLFSPTLQRKYREVCFCYRALTSFFFFFPSFLAPRRPLYRALFTHAPYRHTHEHTLTHGTVLFFFFPLSIKDNSALLIIITIISFETWKRYFFFFLY